MKLINTILGVRFSYLAIFSLQFQERTLASTLDISVISVPRHKEESLGGRSWCLWDPLQLWSYLHWLNWSGNIQIKSMRHYYLNLSSMISILFFEYMFICCNRFREPMIDLHAPYTIQGMGTEWSGVPKIAFY